MKNLLSSFAIALMVVIMIGGAFSILNLATSNSEDYSPDKSEPSLHTVTFIRGDDIVSEQFVGHGTIMSLCCCNTGSSGLAGFMGWASYGSINTVHQVLILRDTTFRALIATDEVLFNLTEHNQTFVTTQDTVVEFTRNNSVWFQRIVGTGSIIRFEIGEPSGANYRFYVYIDNQRVYQVTTSGEISVRGRALV